MKSCNEVMMARVSVKKYIDKMPSREDIDSIITA